MGALTNNEGNTMTTSNSIDKSTCSYCGEEMDSALLDKDLRCPDCVENKDGGDWLPLCSDCNGSGEGMYENTICWNCHGKGTV